jgi:hypothetical protein
VILLLAVALGAVIALAATLRAISVSGQATPAAVADAMQGSGVYIARKRLLATGSPGVVLAGETAFRSLLDMRDATAQGKALDWPDFRPANHGIAKEAWTLRQAARSAHDQPRAIQRAVCVHSYAPQPHESGGADDPGSHHPSDHRPTDRYCRIAVRRCPAVVRRSYHGPVSVALSGAVLGEPATLAARVPTVHSGVVQVAG